MLRLSRSIGIEEAPHSAWAFFGVAALLFAASVAATFACTSSMDGMPMPGGWTMSMAWMRMPGQPWMAATGLFVGMWTVMMAAMMLPPLVPMLWRYRRAVEARGAKLAWLTALAGTAYLFVWSMVGLAVYPLGMALAALAMRLPGLARMVPLLAAVAVLAAGAVQFTAWKARRLACCRSAPQGRALRPHAATAWRHGMHLGLHCSACCANLTAVLLVAGVMDLRAMAAVAAAVAVERLAPVGAGAARIVGAVTMVAGLLLVARAAGLA